MKYAIGMDLGGTNFRAAAVDIYGNVLGNIPRRASFEHESLAIEGITSDLQAIMGAFPTDELVGVGLSVPGLLSPDTRTVRTALNLPGFTDFPICDELESRLGCTVVAENDGNAAALGEK